MHNLVPLLWDEAPHGRTEDETVDSEPDLLRTAAATSKDVRLAFV